MDFMMPWKPAGMPCAYGLPPKLGSSTAPLATLNAGSTSPRIPETWWTTCQTARARAQERDARVSAHRASVAAGRRRYMRMRMCMYVLVV